MEGLEGKAEKDCLVLARLPEPGPVSGPSAFEAYRVDLSVRPHKITSVMRSIKGQRPQRAPFPSIELRELSGREDGRCNQQYPLASFIHDQELTRIFAFYSSCYDMISGVLFV
jgi:hypothetical protein